MEFRRAWEKNAENIDHLRVHPDVRDLSVLVGDEEDVLDRPFGPDLPNMRQWAREHFAFSGYTYHFDPADYRDKAGLRRELGFRDDERVILVSVGGTSVGQNLLRKCAEAFTLIAHKIPDTRMLLVAGPRLSPDELPQSPRIDVRPFVPQLFRHHAAAHLAIVQGGLTSTMELAAFHTPFLYFPAPQPLGAAVPRHPTPRSARRRDPDGLRPHQRGGAGRRDPRPPGQARPLPGRAGRRHRARRPDDREPALAPRGETPWPSK